MQYFKTILLPEADNFMNGLNPKVKKKMFDIVKRAEGSNDARFLKN
jgi:hypothetical protein